MSTGNASGEALFFAPRWKNWAKKSFASIFFKKNKKKSWSLTHSAWVTSSRGADEETRPRIQKALLEPRDAQNLAGVLKAERIEKSFITKGLKERESDLIWKLGLKGDEGKFKKGQKLPAVFPVVLYNGDERWTAPEAIEDLIASGVNSQHIPRFKYFTS